MNKTNYQKIMEDEIKNISGERKKLLLHSCCGPCSSYVISYLKDYFDLAIYFYNPNIHPKEEYYKRLDAQKKIISKFEGVCLIAEDYKPSEFFSFTYDYKDEKEGGARCAKCFELRLRKLQEKADKLGFDYFTTTLTVSPHKDSQLINKIAREIEDEKKDSKASYLFSDFKKKNGYKISIDLSKKYDLYRQDYCGCIYSLRDKEDEISRKI